MRAIGAAVVDERRSSARRRAARARGRRLRRDRPPARLAARRGSALPGDPQARPVGSDRRGDRDPAGADRREVELAAVADERSAGWRRRHRRTPVPYVPPDPETIGVTRRQFFNRGIVALTCAGLAGFGAAAVGFLWSAPKGGFGGKINIGKLYDIIVRDRAGRGLLLRPRPMWIRLPGRGPAQSRKIYASPVLTARRPASTRCTRSARTLDSACRTAFRRSGSNAPATAASTTGSARSAVARRPAAWTASASSISGGEVTLDTGAIFLGPADRHQHDRPGGRGSALHHGWGVTLMFAIATWEFTLFLWASSDRLGRLRRRQHLRQAEPQGGRGRFELAPNRKPYYDDEALGGPRLERVQLFGLLTSP